MKNENGVIAIYSRKSKFTGKGESIGNQVDLCREYIRLHYGDAEADKAIVFEDEGFSGGNIKSVVNEFCISEKLLQLFLLVNI